MISADITNETRKQIYRRDGYACALCGDVRRIQIHHAIPRSLGGKDCPMNLITLCMPCHALAHGADIRGIGLDREWAEQHIVEYLSDLYAPEWWPWREGYNPGG